MAIEKLDNLILVGFKKIDESTPGGRAAKRYLMDAVNVEGDKIFFYDAGTDPKEIVRSSFRKDPSKKKTANFDIGRSMCLVSDSVDKLYRQTIKQLEILTIDTRVGMQDVTLENMTESQVVEWIKTGSYNPDSSPTDNETSQEDEDDEWLDSILSSGDDDDDDVDVSHDDEVTEETDNSPVNDNNRNPSNDEGDISTSSTQEEPVEQQEAPATEDTPQEEGAEAVPTRFSKDEDSSYDDFISVLDDDDFDDDLLEDYDDYDNFNDEDTDYDTPEEVEDEPQPERRRSRIPFEDDPDDIDTKIKEADEVINKSKQDENFSDNELIIEDQKRKKQALLRKKKKASKNKAAPESRGRTLDEREVESSIFNAQVDSSLEPRYKSDGSVMTSRDMLSEKQRVQADVEAEAAREFGDFKAGASAYSDAIGKDTGRIILVSSGKGGVGKSIVSSGLATALVLARAKSKKDNPQTVSNDVWLIESDYNSPQLSITYKIDPHKHLGNVAEYLSKNEGRINTEELGAVINENTHIDPRTGLKVLACPPLSQRRSSKSIPFAILSAIKYASENGDDVIVDHGNLTDGTYSALDQTLSIKVAHRVLLVANMGCLNETKSVISILTQKDPGRDTSVTRVPATVSVALNSAGGEAQYREAQRQLGHFKIINWIQSIPHLRPENSMTGETNINTLPEQDRKAIIDRTGYMLSSLGYPELGRYFSGNAKIKVGKPKRRGLVRKFIDYLGR